MCPSPENTDARSDDETPDGDGGGQVSETSAMTPGSGNGDTPGTDDGVPPAAEAGTEPGGPPGSYGD